MNLEALWKRHVEPFWLRVARWNDLTDWLMAGSALVVTVLAFELMRRLARGRLKRLAEKGPTIADDAVVAAMAATHRVFEAIVALAVGIWVLKVPDWLNAATDRTVLIALILQAAIWAQTAIMTVLDSQRDRAEHASRRTVLAAFGFVSKVVIWSFVLIILLANLGVEVTGLVAGLGIGGVAAALAVQNVLGDFISSVSLLFDRPFDIGDFIIVGSELGTVERLNLRSTRVRALGGQQIIFPNSDLIKSRIHNYGRMMERRILFDFSITYETPYDTLRRVPGMVREVIESCEGVRFDRSHFKRHGAYALEFENVYYVLTGDYGAYMDRQQEINLEIHRRFEEEGIQFALPTQTLHLAEPAWDPAELVQKD